MTSIPISVQGYKKLEEELARLKSERPAIIQAIKEAGLKPGKDILTGSIDGVPDIYKAMIDGEANASVELTPNMAGPAFDALEKFKKDGTQPEKLTITKSTLYLPDTAKEELEKKKNMGY